MRRVGPFLLCALLVLLCAAAPAAEISFDRQVRPILSESCAGCHRPGKLKGKLDLTNYKALYAGGKSGPAFVPGKPGDSLLVKQVSGPTPQMPDKGDPLTPAQVKLIEQWIAEGAHDDSAEVAAVPNEGVPDRAPVYRISPVITALAYSPDGKSLLVGGRNEILFRSADGGDLIKRLPCRAARVTFIGFSPDGGEMIAVGGAPGQYGEVETWQCSDWSSIKRFAVSSDTLFGPSLSPDGGELAVGCADKSVRILSLTDGVELQRLEPHTDWALGAVFAPDGKHVATTSRDKTVKLIDLDRPQEIQDLIDPTDPIVSLAESPTDHLLACGTSTGGLRLYRLVDAKKPTEANRDPNRVKELEHQPGQMNALSYSRDGSLLAAASVGEVRVYKKDGGRVASLSGLAGPVYAISFSPDGTQLAAGGFDGKIHVYHLPDGKPVINFVPFPIEP
jgi:WD40 repeat protein